MVMTCSGHERSTHQQATVAEAERNGQEVGADEGLEDVGEVTSMLHEPRPPTKIRERDFSLVPSERVVR